MKYLLAFTLAFSSLTALPTITDSQEGPIWFSQDWNKMYIQITLVPEEDSPFHYGVWGLERGSHIFEVRFFSYHRTLMHSKACECSTNQNAESKKS